MSKQEVLKNIILTHYSMTCLALPGLSWKHSTASRANYMNSISFPMRFLTTVLRSDRGKPNPCITEETRELMKSRNYWRKRARKTNNPAEWSTYKNLRHQARKLIRAAESEFVKDQIQNNPRNTNCIWKAIRLCLPKRSVTPKVYSEDDKTVADDFNNFFVSVGKSTDSKIESLAEKHNFVLHENAFTPKYFPTSEQFTLNYVDCKQVADVINAMPSNKAPGIDKVPTRVLKDSLLITLPSITSIINASLLASENSRNYTYSQTKQPRTS